MSVITTEWLEARVTATQTTIVAIEGAIDALMTGAQSYTLDTGQTRQVVTKANLTELRNSLAYYENRLATLEQRLCKSARIIGRPGF